MNTSAVIFSTEKSKKNDSWFSLMQIGNITMIQRIYIALHAAGIESVYMFCSVAEKKEIESLDFSMPIIFVNQENSDEWKQDTKSDCFVLAPTNYPFFDSHTVVELLEYERVTVAPRYKDKRGFPVILSHEDFLHKIVRKFDDYIENIAEFLEHTKMIYLPVDDAGTVIDTSNAKEYARALKENSLLNWYPKVKFRIANEEPFFGPGCVELLTRIEKTESVRLASEEMQMSYSKSWKLLNELEKQCGYEVLSRTKGGKGGGQTTLTQKGKALLTWYDTLKKEVDEFAVKLFLENLPPR